MRLDILIKRIMKKIVKRNFYLFMILWDWISTYQVISFNISTSNEYQPPSQYFFIFFINHESLSIIISISPSYLQNPTLHDVSWQEKSLSIIGHHVKHSSQVRLVQVIQEQHDHSQHRLSLLFSLHTFLLLFNIISLSVNYFLILPLLTKVLKGLLF